MAYKIYIDLYMRVTNHLLRVTGMILQIPNLSECPLFLLKVGINITMKEGLEMEVAKN